MAAPSSGTPSPVSVFASCPVSLDKQHETAPLHKRVWFHAGFFGGFQLLMTDREHPVKQDATIDLVLDALLSTSMLCFVIVGVHCLPVLAVSKSGSLN
jgi:hypothetical protein